MAPWNEVDDKELDSLSEYSIVLARCCLAALRENRCKEFGGELTDEWGMALVVAWGENKMSTWKERLAMVRCSRVRLSGGFGWHIGEARIEKKYRDQDYLFKPQLLKYE
ncbi:hypothetical protein E2562_013460 [Oryza meyeriana var. granulata]|uniref:Uncharacterized protein n=1 Tax=Oryza meyeriana var. granulata TaxID=110450 RepID=A0A6G1BWP8_9ORYZ|nr:hypothetical protein E2562_013460 [Oryza meyeriana var. granulata]